MTTIPEDAQVNEAGQVAMKYRKLAPILVTCGNKQYVFVIRANIPLAWIDPEHIPCVGAVKWGCCGRKKPGGVLFANESDVRRWTNGGGR